MLSRLNAIRKDLQKDKSNSIEHELVRYGNAVYEDVSWKTKGAAWWNGDEGKGKFPKMALCATAIFGAPGTSVPVEQLFSISGMKTAGRRNRLQGIRLEKETALHKNKQYYEHLL